MGQTSLNKLIGKAALSHHIPGDKWPIRDQFVGIEIELENVDRKQQLDHEDGGAPYWEPHDDGSLRNGIEYVLREPLMGSQLTKAISYFYSHFTKYNDGPRTSIHVHLNMRQNEDSFESLKNLLVLYYMYEEAFFKFADENRKWCAYCNPFEDNPPAILTDVMRMTPETAPRLLFTRLNVSAGRNTNRYYGLNITALQRFGTLEFRHLPLVKEEQKLVQWIMLLMELKAAARRLTEEGLTVEQFITDAADVKKLQHYFPMFWDMLNQYVSGQDAYLRMVNLLGLTLLAERPTGNSMADNKAWAAYTAEQIKRGKTVKPTQIRRMPLRLDEPEEDDEEDIHLDFEAVENQWRTVREVAPPPAARRRGRVPPPNTFELANIANEILRVQEQRNEDEERTFRAFDNLTGF
jgi:hypothetical protein